MQKTSLLLVAIASAAAMAVAEPPASPNLPQPPPSPGGFGEGPRIGARGNAETMRERPLRPMGGDGEGMILRMLTGDSRMAQELGLSDAQIKQIKDSVAGSEKDMKDLNGKMEQAALRQADFMKADALDEEAIMKAVQEAGELRTEIAKMRVKQAIAAYKILTPEQRTKLREKMKERMDQMQTRIKEAQQRMGGGAREGRGGRQPGAGQGRGGDAGATAPQPPAPPAVR